MVMMVERQREGSPGTRLPGPIQLRALDRRESSTASTDAPLRRMELHACKAEGKPVVVSQDVQLHQAVGEERKGPGGVVVGTGMVAKIPKASQCHPTRKGD